MSLLFKATALRTRISAFLIILLLGVLPLRSDQIELTNSAPSIPATGTDPDAKKEGPATITTQDLLRGILLTQEQLQNTQEQLQKVLSSFEKNQQNNERAFTTNAQLTQAKLDLMDKERHDSFESMQHSNKWVLRACGISIFLGLLALTSSAALQFATIRRLTVATSYLKNSQSIQALNLGDGHLLFSQAMEQTNTRLITMIDRLEKRVMEIESTRQLPVIADQNGVHPKSETNGHSSDANGHGAEIHEFAAPEGLETVNKVRTLLGKGPTLLKLDKAEEALFCLDEALSIDPSQLDALIKKGAALERLQRFPEAIACYDMAIAKDGTMTMAYLYKGAVFNRLERYSEALECYEQALKSRQKKEQAANVIFDELD